MNKYYFIGIKGTGMASLAQVLSDLGNYVCGSDCREVFFTDEILNNKKIEFKEFCGSNIKSDMNDFVFIASSCYDDSNIEIYNIKKYNYKLFYYHEFIEHFFSGIKIGVSGAHGKTTTTSFLKQLFSEVPLCSIIGDGTGFGVRNYDYTIFEACEYKDHILTYNFDYLILNNIDLEHLDYFVNEDNIFATFKKASSNAKYFVCNEDILINHPDIYKFGFSESSFCFCKIIEENSKGYLLDITIDNKNFRTEFYNYGKHMIKNLLACVVVYYLCGMNLFSLPNKIKNLKRPRRRMEEYIKNTNIIIDDYAHHPTEIKALLESIKQKYENLKIIVFFEPHTYSRTEALKEKFKSCFEGVDELYLADTFTSKREVYDYNREQEIKKIFEYAKEFTFNLKIEDFQNSVIVFLGGGNIRKYIKEFIK